MLTRTTNLTDAPLSLDEQVELLRAAGEHTRLRLLSLLSAGDLTVTDLIEILGQSQPRISRHLRLLGEAGLLERYSEGAWAYFRLVEDGPAAQFASALLQGLDGDDTQLARDRERLEKVRRRRAQKAANYFAENAGAWDELRSLHVDEARVEAAMRSMIGNKPIQAMLDVGTGTGRLLELFSPIFVRATGIDASRDMLSVARANLDKADLSRVQVRQGDVYLLPTRPGQFDLVTIHQVLHFLDDPGAAIRESARALGPGGHMLIADFAPHDLKFLQEQHAHLRMGFSHDQISGWLEEAGLEVVEVKDLPPEGGDGHDRLTVTLWLARDPRQLIASSQTSIQGTPT